MTRRVPHVITIDGKKFSAMLPDIYGDIKSIVGIERAPNPDNIDYTGKISVSAGVRDGNLSRIRVRLENNKVKNILCVSSKFASAMGGILSKKVAGVDVRSTGVQRRMRLG